MRGATQLLQGWSESTHGLHGSGDRAGDARHRHGPQWALIPLGSALSLQANSEHPPSWPPGWQWLQRSVSSCLVALSPQFPGSPGGPVPAPLHLSKWDRAGLQCTTLQQPGTVRTTARACTKSERCRYLWGAQGRGSGCLQRGIPLRAALSLQEFRESNYCVFCLQWGGSLSPQRADAVPERETTSRHWSVRLRVICKRSQPNKLFTLSFGSQLEQVSAEGNKTRKRRERGRERRGTVFSAY